MTEITETLTVEQLDELEEIARKNRDRGPLSADSDAYPFLNAFRAPTVLSLLAMAREGLTGRTEIADLKRRLQQRVDQVHEISKAGENRLIKDATKLALAEAELAAARERVEQLQELYAGSDMAEKLHAERAEAAEARMRGLSEALERIVNQAVDIDGETRLTPDWRQSQKIALTALPPPTGPGEGDHHGG